MIQPGFACNLDAIPADALSRYHNLRQRLQKAIVHRTEEPDGYSFRLSGEKVRLTEVAEWMEMERRCCPFLTLQISVSGEPGCTLRLAGPGGVKPILAEAFRP